MAVLNFSYAAVKDIDAFKSYVQQAAILMEASGVEIIVRGEYAATKRGEKLSPHIAAIFRYPDMATAEAFYTSEAYLKLIPLRDKACEMTIQFYNE